ncbi:MAG: hypothetical protein AAB300_04020 [Nitrospirota bacterium]
MKQLNINITPQFEKDLKLYMKRSNLTQKSEAIRLAIEESAARLKKTDSQMEYRAWLGLDLKAPLSAKLRFKNENDLWE